MMKKPAGVFYFKIGDPRVDLTGIARESSFLKKFQKK